MEQNLTRGLSTYQRTPWPMKMTNPAKPERPFSNQLQSWAYKWEVNEAELTPSNQSKSPQILPIREEGHEDEAVEVETLDQDPVVVCGQEVHEQRHHHLAANLCTKFCK